MRIIILMLKDLTQILRDKKSLIFLLAMPLVFTVFMGFAFRGAGQEQDTRLPLGWQNLDPSGAAALELRALLEESGAVRLVDLAADADAGAFIRSGKAAGVLTVPADFTAAALDGRPVQVVLAADETDAAGQALLQLGRSAVIRLMSAAEISILSVQAVQSRGKLQDAAGRSAEELAAFQAALRTWEEAAAGGVQVRVEKGQVEVDPASNMGGNPYNQSSPGILVQFAIFALVTAAGILVQERRTRTLQRLLTTAMRPWEVILGHLLAMFTLVFVQGILLILFGQFVLQVNYLAQPLGSLLVMAGLALWVASLGLLISVISKNDEQVILYSLIAMFLFTALGGAWFPLEGTGGVFAAVGGLTPGAWAMQGFQNILLRGLGLASSLLPAAVLGLYALGFFGLAVWLFARQKEF